MSLDEILDLNLLILIFPTTPQTAPIFYLQTQIQKQFSFLFLSRCSGTKGMPIKFLA